MRKGGGGEGKFLRADSKVKRAKNNVNKGRTGKSFPLTYPSHPRISAMEDKR